MGMSLPTLYVCMHKHIKESPVCPWLYDHYNLCVSIVTYRPIARVGGSKGSAVDLHDPPGSLTGI